MGFRTLRLHALDLIDRITRRRDPLMPSRVQIERIGGYDFREVGRRLADLAIRFGELEPHERIFDVGCGFGRLAMPLTKWLTTGEYAGFDIDAEAVAWCRRAIGSRHPNFWFAHADVANSYYNPRGAIDPATFALPCAGGSVDVAFASSLFTHLLPAAADHYVAEIARILKPRGRVVASFFLLDDEIDHEHASPRFTVRPEPYYAIADPREPEHAVAYDANAVVAAFARHGIEVVHIERGSWRARVNPATYQDVVVGVR